MKKINVKDPTGILTMKTQKDFTPKQVRRAVKRVKDRLIKKCASHGIYENFGQKERRELEDKYVNISRYTDDMNEIRNIIRRFGDWASSYNG